MGRQNRAVCRSSGCHGPPNPLIYLIHDGFKIQTLLTRPGAGGCRPKALEASFGGEAKEWTVLPVVERSERTFAANVNATVVPVDIMNRGVYTVQSWIRF